MIPSLEDIIEFSVGFVFATIALSLFYVFVGVSNTEELTEKIRSKIQ